MEKQNELQGDARITHPLLYLYLVGRIHYSNLLNLFNNLEIDAYVLPKDRKILPCLWIELLHYYNSNIPLFSVVLRNLESHLPPQEQEIFAEFLRERKMNKDGIIEKIRPGARML